MPLASPSASDSCQGQADSTPFSDRSPFAALPLDIPLDVHRVIVPLLAKADLASYGLLDYDINLIVTPYLYKRLEIDWSKKKTIPVFPTGSSNCTCTHFQLDDISGAVDPVGTSSKRHEAERPCVDQGGWEGNQLAACPGRFSYTTHLTMTSHPLSFCTGTSDIFPILPNLHTLHIRCGSFLDCCMAGRPGMTTPRALWPFILHLRPRRLVIGGPTTCMKGTFRGLHGADQAFPPPWIEELVVRTGACGIFESYRYKAMGALSRLPSSLGQFILIVESEFRDDGPWHTKDNCACVHNLGCSKWYRQVWLWKKLCRAFEGKARSMLVVGLENVDMGKDGPSTQEKAEELRLEVKEMLVQGRQGGRSGVRQGRPVKEAKARADMIRFISLEEYQNGDGHDIM